MDATEPFAQPPVDATVSPAGDKTDHAVWTIPKPMWLIARGKTILTALLASAGGGAVVGLPLLLMLAKKELPVVEKAIAPVVAPAAPAPGLVWLVGKAMPQGTWFVSADDPPVHAYVARSDLDKRAVAGKPWAFGCGKCGTGETSAITPFVGKTMFLPPGNEAKE